MICCPGSDRCAARGAPGRRA